MWHGLNPSTSCLYVHLVLRVQGSHESQGTRFNNKWPEQEKSKYLLRISESVLFGDKQNMYGFTGDE